MNPSFVNGPQGRLHVDDGGRGSAVPVLFVHGNTGNLTQWRAQLDHVRQSRRAVAFDLRGMGQSETARNGDYSIKAMADDVEAVVDALQLRHFVIVGHSYGGTVVAAYAAGHPDRVAGVVFADSAGNVKIDPKQANAFLDRIRADKDAVVPQWFAPILKGSRGEVKNAVLESTRHTPADVIAGALGGLLDVDMRQFLAAYRGPRIAIAAADIESPASLHVQFPDIPVKKIRGTGHWLMMDKPDAFNALLDEFLAIVDRRVR
ncbi:MAG TPA: alpha/beta hydrolase [Thermoanaerobaculia bacterium]|nr:alpha/beta hydrolase [Thermoanaerobaculia bacterium]